MLQSATPEETLPVTSFFLAILIVFAIWLVDIKKIFALTNLWCNILIIGLVLFHLNTLLHSPVEFIAFSIANILGWLQVILFFREKLFRVQIHILTLSFILTCVGAVTQQRLFFAVLLILYFLTFVCTVSLILLEQEKKYYETHAFMRPPFGLDSKEAKQSPYHYLRLAFGTLFLTPILLLFGYRTGDTEKAEQERLEKLRRRSIRQNNRSFHHFRHKESVMGDRIFGFWESAEEKSLLEPYNPSLNKTNREEHTRFDLLYRKPVFSGSSRTDRELTFSKELAVNLLWSILCSFFFALIVFYFFPRFQRIEIGGFQVGHDHWQARESIVRSTIGFNETMHLGELGPTQSNFEPVLSIRLVKAENSESYFAGSNGPVYLRGTTLAYYKNKQWSRRNDYEELRRLQIHQEPDYLRIAYNFDADNYAKELALYDTSSDFIKQEVEMLPTNSNIIFAVWPFFQINARESRSYFDGEWYVTDTRFNWRPRRRNFIFYTNTFRNGTQLPLTPNQEYFEDINVLLTLDREIFPELIKKAQDWDKESGLSPEDFIGRAKFLEKKLRDSGQFTYTLEGVLRQRDIDPLEDFVSLHPSGHCEYFAGALTLMLRAIGIPSRVILGFAYDPDLDVNSRTTVRQSDAHAWVEAYIPNECLVKTDALGELAPSKKSTESIWWKNGGWLRLDATPYSQDEFLTSAAKKYYSLTEFFQSFWGTYILNYNSYVQSKAVYSPCQELWSFLREKYLNVNYWKNLFPSIKFRAIAFYITLKSGRWSTDLFLSFILPIISMAVFLFTFIWIFYKIYKFIKRTRKSIPSAEQAFLTSSYGKLEKMFARRGIYRERWETSKEFVERAIHDSRFPLLLEDRFREKYPEKDPNENAGMMFHVREIFIQEAFEGVRQWYKLRFGKNA